MIRSGRGTGGRPGSGGRFRAARDRTGPATGPRADEGPDASAGTGESAGAEGPGGADGLGGSRGTAGPGTGPASGDGADGAGGSGRGGTAGTGRGGVRRSAGDRSGRGAAVAAGADGPGRRGGGRGAGRNGTDGTGRTGGGRSGRVPARPVRSRIPGLLGRRSGMQPKVVALGGGHGLSASLAALRRITGDLTAVVTVADDGGSSGRLRDELGVLPPGDLRKALAALCGDDEWGRTWSEVIQHRFTSKGELHGHAVGNLLIVALWEQLDDHVAALDLVGRLLGAQGRVLPMSAVPLDLEAVVRGHDPGRPDEIGTVRGQATVALTPGEVQEVRLRPHNPPAVPEAVAAVLDADWVVLGPGSWFSSVMPHLLVPELAGALLETKARKVLTLNLAPQPGETEGFSPQRHLDVLAGHAPKLAVDVVLADEAAVYDDRASLQQAAERLHGTVELAPVAAGTSRGGAAVPRHDPELLAAAYDRIFRMHGRIGPWR